MPFWASGVRTEAGAVEGGTVGDDVGDCLVTCEHALVTHTSAERLTVECAGRGRAGTIAVLGLLAFEGGGPLPDLAVSAGTAGGAGPFEDARAGGKTPRKTWPRDFGPRDDARVVAVDPTGDTSTRGTARPA